MSQTTALSRPGFTLPLTLNPGNKYRVALLFAAIGALCYLLPNHFPLREPRLLPMGLVDEAVPFVPWTFWIYLSEYALFISTYVVCRDLANANKYLYSFMAMQLFACLLFVFFPTTYPRADWPLTPEMTGPLTYAAFTLFRKLDTANNCCPSLHVSSVYLAAYVYLDEQRQKLPFYFIWASAVAVSTLTTKQHYFVDIVAGLGLATTSWFVFHRLVRYRAAPGFQPNR